MFPDFPDLKSEIQKLIVANIRHRVNTGDPVLSEIKRFRQHEGDHLRYEQVGGDTVEEGFEKIGAEFTTRPEEVPDLVGPNLDAKVGEIAQKLTSLSAKSFFRKMGEITEKAGTSVDARGKPVSAEMMLDVLEKVQMEFNSDGRPAQAFVIHPSMAPALQEVENQIQNDPELKRRRDNILERQREAWAARESNRKLVD